MGEVRDISCSRICKFTGSGCSSVSVSPSLECVLPSSLASVAGFDLLDDTTNPS
jgi:hypothetical protein